MRIVQQMQQKRPRMSSAVRVSQVDDQVLDQRPSHALTDFRCILPQPEDTRVRPRSRS